MTPETASKVRAAGPIKDIATARRVLSVWLDAAGHERDRWGNWHVGDGLRIHLTARMMQRQSKAGGGWYTVRSTAILDAAHNVVVNAERALGAEGDPKEAIGQRAARDAKMKRAASARGDKNLQARAEELTMKRAHREYPAETATVLSGGRIADAKAQEINAATLGWVEEALSLLRTGSAPPGDGAFASADRPPLLPMLRRISYSWIERVGDVAYSVRIESRGGGRAALHIGKAAGYGMQVDPITHWIKARIGHDEGDAYISGQIAYKDGRVEARLYMAEARVTGLGGIRAGSLWCRMMRGYGVRAFVAERLLPEGEKFLELLARRGSVEILRRAGGDALVACGAAS